MLEVRLGESYSLGRGNDEDTIAFLVPSKAGVLSWDPDVI
jgi:hypothetical protein